MLNKQKYLELLRSEGLSAAITQLHLDTNNWEIDSFEGPDGYKPKQYDALAQVREFSRELWDLAMTENPNDALKARLNT
jgi:hypothetical protein